MVRIASKMRIVFQCALLLLFTSCFNPHAARAQLKHENLIVSLPTGYKVRFRTTQNDMNMQEWIPQAVSTDDWTEMVTVQIFFGKKDFTAGQFLSNIGQQWLATCQGSKPNTIHSGTANGYPVSMLLLQSH